MSQPRLRDTGFFQSAHVEWGTPPDLKAALDSEFRFTLDPCPPGAIWDGRIISWAGHRVFCNPPYQGRRIKTWLPKWREAELAVFLLPARTDSAWFHDLVLPDATEIRFFRGRLKFVEGHAIPAPKTWRANAAPFPSMLVVFMRGDDPQDTPERGT